MAIICELKFAGTIAPQIRRLQHNCQYFLTANRLCVGG